MLTESQLNVFIQGADLTPRQRERLQAQLQTALRSLPSWLFGLLRRRLAEAGAPNFPLIVSPVPQEEAPAQCISFGSVEGRPAVRLLPRLSGEDIAWGQDLRLVAAKAVAYLASPPEGDAFWDEWAQALAADRLPERAGRRSPHWAGASAKDLLVELFAAYALDSANERWREYPAVRRFFDGWR